MAVQCQKSGPTSVSVRFVNDSHRNTEGEDLFGQLTAQAMQLFYWSRYTLFSILCYIGGPYGAKPTTGTSQSFVLLTKMLGQFPSFINLLF